MVKKNLTRKELTNKIHQNLGFSKRLSNEILDDFFEIIIQQLMESNKIKWGWTPYGGKGLPIRPRSRAPYIHIVHVGP